LGGKVVAFTLELANDWFDPDFGGSAMGMHQSLLRFAVLGAAGAMGSVLAGGCSSEAPQNSVNYGGAGPGGSGGGPNGGTGGGGLGGGGLVGGAGGNPLGGSSGIDWDSGAGGAGAGSSADSGCASNEAGATEKPVDMYVMFDATTTMLCTEPPDQLVTTRFDAFKGALQQFVRLPESNGLGIGIQYFGLNNDSCNVADYARPAVPIAPLPGNAQAIINSLNGQRPRGATPLSAAVQGAVDHARMWAGSSGHTVAVVLVTDGQPNRCGASTVDEVATAAATGLMGGIRTYVIGISVPDNSMYPCGYDGADNGTPDAIHTIARAGGTDQAVVVQTGGNAAQQFLQAILKIKERSAVPCTYQIPPSSTGRPLDFSKVNVNYTPGQGPPSNIFGVGTADKCDPSVPGWFYDNPQNPTSIQLCPGTCDSVSADSGAKVKIVYGCVPTVVPPPK
jgi:hypothetical protein